MYRRGNVLGLPSRPRRLYPQSPSARPCPAWSCVETLPRVFFGPQDYKSRLISRLTSTCCCDIRAKV
jgi:hypothetical protein